MQVKLAARQNSVDMNIIVTTDMTLRWTIWATTGHSRSSTSMPPAGSTAFERQQRPISGVEHAESAHGAESCFGAMTMSSDGYIGYIGVFVEAEKAAWKCQVSSRTLHYASQSVRDNLPVVMHDRCLCVA